MSGLRYELQTDKPFKFLSDQGNDVEHWNKSLKNIHATIGEENATWFKGPWLFAECYLYRRIREALLGCKTEMKHHDVFEKAKLETCLMGRENVSALIRALCPLEKLTTNEELWRSFHSTMQVIIQIN